MKTEELREKLDAELATAEVAWLVKQVELALEARDLEGARDAHPRSSPSSASRSTRARLDELEMLIARRRTGTRPSQDRAQRAAAARRAKEQREAFIAAAFSTVEQRFNARGLLARRARVRPRHRRPLG